MPGREPGPSEPRPLGAKRVRPVCAGQTTVSVPRRRTPSRRTCPPAGPAWFARAADDSGPFADDSPRCVISPLAAADGAAGSAASAPGNPRRTLLIHLAEDLRVAIVAGDIEAACVTHDAMGRLLGCSTTQLAPVTNLALERGNVGAGR